MSVEVRDVEDETICDHFEEIVKFIDEGRAIGNVFLHWYVLFPSFSPSPLLFLLFSSSSPLASFQAVD